MRPRIGAAIAAALASLVPHHPALARITAEVPAAPVVPQFHDIVVDAMSHGHRRRRSFTENESRHNAKRHAASRAASKRARVARRVGRGR